MKERIFKIIDRIAEIAVVVIFLLGLVLLWGLIGYSIHAGTELMMHLMINPSLIDDQYRLGVIGLTTLTVFCELLWFCYTFFGIYAFIVWVLDNIDWR